MPNGEPKEPLSFAKGQERKVEVEQLRTRLQVRTREILDFRMEQGKKYEESTDPDEKDELRRQLFRLDATLKRGADLDELIKEKDPQEIENYISENYRRI